MARTAAPGEANPWAPRRTKPCAPGVTAHPIRLPKWRGGNRLQQRIEGAWQAHQGALQRRICWRLLHQVNIGHDAADQRCQFRLHHQRHIGTLRPHQRCIADELDRIAKTLFPMEQNTPPADLLRTGPKRQAVILKTNWNFLAFARFP